MDVFTNYYRLHKDTVVKRRNLSKYLLSTIEILAILFAFQTSYIINYFEKGNLFYSEKNIFIIFIAILPFWLLTLYLIRSTGIPAKRYIVLSLLYFQSSTAIFFLLTLFYFLFRLDPIHGLFLLELPFFGFLYLFFGRLLIYKVLNRQGEMDNNIINVIIIADDSSLPFIENLLLNKELGYKVVVIFTESATVKSRYENSSIILSEKFSGIISNLTEVDFIDELLYLKERPDSAEVRAIISTCEDRGVTCRVREPDSKSILTNAVKTDIADSKFLSFINIPNNSYAQAIKKTLDINIALLMIVVLCPVMIILSILIKMTSRGPVFIKLSKVGWRGRQIKAYRFRTTNSNPDNEAFYIQAKMKIPWSEYEAHRRVTKVGRFLLKSGLDHLPELFNVLKGEVSITGSQHPLESEKIKFHSRKNA